MNIYRNLYLEEIEKVKKMNDIPTLLLHSCCGPCSSAVLEEVSKYFKVTVLYYNPNIYPEKEYLLRKEEQLRIIKEMKFINPVNFIDSDYIHEDYLNVVKGFESSPEGSERCAKCFNLRLSYTIKEAMLRKYLYYSTTLSVSPHKNTEIINKLGVKLSSNTPVKWLYSDFKKADGYKRSIELSKEHNLYRQNYCGCEFSLNNEILQD